MPVKSKLSKSRSREKGMENLCSFCKKRLAAMPFKCKFCALEFCGEHRLPEDHSCLGLQMRKETLKERIASGKNQLTYEPKVRKEIKVKFDEFGQEYNTNHNLNVEQKFDITKPLLKSPTAIIGFIVIALVIIGFLLAVFL